MRGSTPPIPMRPSPQAFSHFTYGYSQRKLIIVDIQVRIPLTPPDPPKYDFRDVRMQGLYERFISHMITMCILRRLSSYLAFRKDPIMYFFTVSPSTANRFPRFCDQSNNMKKKSCFQSRPHPKHGRRVPTFFHHPIGRGGPVHGSTAPQSEATVRRRRPWGRTPPPHGRGISRLSVLFKEGISDSPKKLKTRELESAEDFGIYPFPPPPRFSG